jgi:hypothetical protein
MQTSKKIDFAEEVLARLCLVKLTDRRVHILRFFSDACRRYYLLPNPDS